MPKIPQWGWILIAVVVLFYVFGAREGLENAPKKPAAPKKPPTS